MLMLQETSWHSISVQLCWPANFISVILACKSLSMTWNEYNEYYYISDSLYKSRFWEVNVSSIYIEHHKSIADLVMWHNKWDESIDLRWYKKGSIRCKHTVKMSPDLLWDLKNCMSVCVLVRGFNSCFRCCRSWNNQALNAFVMGFYWLLKPWVENR